MTPERWRRVKEIVAGALDREAPDRVAWLDRECDADSALRAEVETLLRLDDPASPVLDLDRTPVRIGPYRIVKEIGRGGMGTVYLGERADGQFEQRVAVKVVKRGMDTDAVLRRFYAERQILARLNHPNVARLLEGGMFDDRPYFVMEHLEGVPLLEYCRRERLGIPHRIQLFRSVCSAVEYAHRALVLHRDIKSGNILVDSTGTPKLLDFGIAKVLHPGENEEQTAISMRALTPVSASPEQLLGEPLTTASDVYSLGVLLFELLTGTAPFSMAGKMPAEITRMVCEELPAKPSARAPAIRELRGDLDNIVLKALRKDPRERYQRAAELSQDLGRYVAKVPVEARPGSAAYRTAKFLQRRRVPLAIAAGVAIVLTLAVGNAVVEGQRANRRFRQVRELTNSFLFEFHDAIATLPGSTPARELVVKRALQYLDDLSAESANDAGLRRELAIAYERVGNVQGSPFEANLGHQAEARRSYEKSLRLFAELARARPSDGSLPIEMAEAQLRLAALTNGDDPKQAMKLNRETIALLDRPGQGPLNARAQMALALAWFGIAESEGNLKHVQPAIDARMKSLDLLRDLTARDPGNAQARRYLSQSQKRLAALQITQTHEYGKAVEGLNTAIAIDEARVKAAPLDTTAKLDLALGQSYMARAQWEMGDPPGAVRSLQSAIDGLNGLLAADPRNYRARVMLIGHYTRLGSWLRQSGQAAGAASAWAKGQGLTEITGAFAQRTPEMTAAIDTLHRAAGR